MTKQICKKLHKLCTWGKKIVNSLQGPSLQLLKLGVSVEGYWWETKAVWIDRKAARQNVSLIERFSASQPIRELEILIGLQLNNEGTRLKINWNAGTVHLYLYTHHILKGSAHESGMQQKAHENSKNKRSRLVFVQAHSAQLIFLSCCDLIRQEFSFSILYFAFSSFHLLFFSIIIDIF